MPQRIDAKAAFGLAGDGAADDSAGIKAAEAAMSSHCELWVAPGSYRFAEPNPAGGAALCLDGLSDVGVVFAPGAELVMDNLVDGSGTGHGVYVKGACSNVTLDGVRVRWATPPSQRSFGDGFRFLGYPSDSDPPAEWAATTGTITGITFRGCETINAPQAGAVFLGCTDIHESGFRAVGTKADGLHFNACRRINAHGCTGVDTGDDSLAFVTYYHPADVWQSADGPFNQSELGDWSNNGTVFGVVSSGSAANGVRVAGAHGLTVVGVAVDDAAGCGVQVDATKADGVSYLWSYQASRGVIIDDVTARGCDIGLLAATNNIAAGDDETWWRFDLAVPHATARGCRNWAVRAGGNGTAASVIAGLAIGTITAETSSGNGVGLSSLRDSTVGSVYQRTSNGAQIGLYGQDAVYVGDLDAMPAHNVTVGSVHNDGGPIIVQDLRRVEVAQLKSRSAPVLVRLVDAVIGRVCI